MSTCFSMDVQAFVCLCVYLDIPNPNIYISLGLFTILKCPCVFPLPSEQIPEALGRKEGIFQGHLLFM